MSSGFRSSRPAGPAPAARRPAPTCGRGGRPRSSPSTEARRSRGRSGRASACSRASARPFLAHLVPPLFRLPLRDGDRGVGGLRLVAVLRHDDVLQPLVVFALWIVGAELGTAALPAL